MWEQGDANKSSIVSTAAFMLCGTLFPNSKLVCQSSSNLLNPFSQAGRYDSLHVVLIFE